jgi:hypothetical protein
VQAAQAAVQLHQVVQILSFRRLHPQLAVVVAQMVMLDSMVALAVVARSMSTHPETAPQIKVEMVALANLQSAAAAAAVVQMLQEQMQGRAMAETVETA